MLNKKNMHSKNVIFILMAIFVLSGNCKKKPLLKIENDRVTETLPGSRVSAAYMNVHNLSEKDDTLISVDSDDFETAEFHNMREEDGIMKMEALNVVNIKAGEVVKFAPGGMHIMLINNKKDIKSGQKIKINLHFENAGLMTLNSSVKSIQEQVE